MSADLKRAFAPVTEAVWAAIDAEATHTLKATLAARKVVDFRGPLGWQTSAIPTGRAEGIDLGPGAVQGRLRQVSPLVELKVPFHLSVAELETIDRGNPAPDLSAVTDAARAIAAAEDRLVFDGHGDAGIWGVGGGDHDSLQLGTEPTDLQESFAAAVTTLMRRGVRGPFCAAVGPALYERLLTTRFGGHTALEVIGKLLGGSVVWAPTLGATALVLSRRGGDFELVIGRDLSVGFTAATGTRLSFYLQESLTFQALDPSAAVRIVSL